MSREKSVFKLNPTSIGSVIAEIRKEVNLLTTEWKNKKLYYFPEILENKKKFEIITNYGLDGKPGVKLEKVGVLKLNPTKPKLYVYDTKIATRLEDELLTIGDAYDVIHHKK